MTINVPKGAPIPIPILAPKLRAEVEAAKGIPDAVVVRVATIFEGEELEMELVLIFDGSDVVLALVNVGADGVIILKKSDTEKLELSPI